jgi:predicted ribosome quality control (RQC) complex YloA/Tae2 family protein
MDEISGADSARLEEIRQEIAKRFPKLRRKRSGRRDPVPLRLPFHEIAISGGRSARVGRSAADNDALTLRFARPEDLWLHVRGQKGSHVVVPMGRGEEPSGDILVDAAHLAAHFSDARDQTDVEVIYTRRRHVQKPKGSPPGSVRLLREKTIFLRVDSGRLKRILNPEHKSD